jgi:hypothetical protein
MSSSSASPVVTDLQFTGGFLGSSYLFLAFTCTYCYTDGILILDSGDTGSFIDAFNDGEFNSGPSDE